MNNRKIGFPGNHPLTPWAWIVTAWLVLALAPPALAKGKPSGDSGGGGTDSGTIELVATGAATAFQSCQERLDASTTSYLCNKTVTGDETIQLEQFFQDHVADFAKCFGGGSFSVAIGVQVNKDGSAASVMRFWAKNKSGKDVLYVLEVEDSRGWDGAFPPEVGVTATMGEVDSDAIGGVNWILRTSSKREAANACTAEGQINPQTTAFIVVDFTRID